MTTAHLPQWLADAVASLQRGDVEGWMSLYAADAVHEFPFAPDGSPQRLEGRDAIATCMRAIFAGLRFGPLSDVRVREAGAETIVEAVGHHIRLSDGARRDVSFVWIITREGDRVTRYRDYMNPLQLAAI